MKMRAASKSDQIVPSINNHSSKSPSSVNKEVMLMVDTKHSAYSYSYSSSASTPPSSSGHLEVPWFARVPNDCDSDQEFYQQLPLNLVKTRKVQGRVIREPRLPSDPRKWSRADVCSWLEWTLSSHNLPPVSGDKFLMNGKAMCLMSIQMFTFRVPLGGKLLYRDFQLRLARAVNNLKSI